MVIEYKVRSLFLYRETKLMQIGAQKKIFDAKTTLDGNVLLSLKPSFVVKSVREVKIAHESTLFSSNILRDEKHLFDEIMPPDAKIPPQHPTFSTLIPSTYMGDSSTRSEATISLQ